MDPFGGRIAKKKMKAEVRKRDVPKVESVHSAGARKHQIPVTV